MPQNLNSDEFVGFVGCVVERRVVTDVVGTADCVHQAMIMHGHPMVRTSVWISSFATLHETFKVGGCRHVESITLFAIRRSTDSV